MSIKFLNNKTILLTGCSRGLGLSILRELKSCNCKIIAITRNKDKNLSDMKNIKNLNCDLSDPKALVKTLIANNIEPNSIDYAILCAAIKKSDNQNNFDNYQQTLNINLLSNVNFCYWIKNSSAHTLVISSIGRYHGMINSIGYNSSKAALSIFTEGLIMDQLTANGRATYGIVEPGFIKTTMIKQNFLSNMFGVSSEHAAKLILRSLIYKKKHLSFPIVFKLLTYIFTNLSITIKLKLLNLAKKK